MTMSMKSLLSFRRRQPREHSPTPFVFDDARLQSLAQAHKESYHCKDPFPHAVVDDFLPCAVADELLARFPPPYAPFWADWKTGDTANQPRKQELRHIKHLEGADPFLFSVLFAFSSYTFIHFLETLTGINGLIPDPHYQGGGLHQILPGGKLRIHADFNYHKTLELYRKVNVHFYLNRDWKLEYGGYLEFWNSDMTCCVRSLSPKFNRLVVFNTDRHTYHGHPEPLACPEGITRKSLACYYYTRHGFEAQIEPHSTLWQARPDTSATSSPGPAD